MEAASLPLPRRLFSRAGGRKARRAARLAADADRFERAASRLEQQLGSDEPWQVRHLRRSADELRRLADRELLAA
jgi:hypothetical protein